MKKNKTIKRMNFEVGQIVHLKSFYERGLLCEPFIIRDFDARGRAICEHLSNDPNSVWKKQKGLCTCDGYFDEPIGTYFNRKDMVNIIEMRKRKLKCLNQEM